MRLGKGIAMPRLLRRARGDVDAGAPAEDSRL